MSDHFLFNEIVENLMEAVLVISGASEIGKLQIVYANPAFTSLLGFQQNETIGHEPAHVNLDTAEIRQALKRVRDQGHPERFNLRVTSKTEEKHRLEAQVFPLSASEGEAELFALLLREICENKLMEAQLTALARTDGLTGLLNWRTFFEYLQSEWLRVQRYHTTCSLALVEMDQFDSVLEVHGEAICDVVLRMFSAHLQALARAQDVVCRRSGNQFAVLMPETDLEHALIGAERLRTEIAAIVVTTKAWAVDLTISAGVSQLLSGDEHSDDVVLRTERAMDIARSLGRNRVCKA